MFPHIVVVDPAVVKPELSAFNRMAVKSPFPLTFHLPALFGSHTLMHDTEAVRGIIILGSKASVHEKHAWQTDIAHWLRARWEAKVPTLGICYGHQLIAHLFGGKVGHAFPDKAKHVGFRTVALRPNRLWDLPKEGNLYYSHEEAVLDVPAGMSVLATSSSVEVEGLEHRDLPVWSLQTHPETVSVKEGVPRTHNDLAFGHQLVDEFLRVLGR